MEGQDNYLGVSLEWQRLLGESWKVHLQGAEARSWLCNRGDADAESDGNF